MAVALNTLDELYLHLDREDEPWSVHLEVRVEGSVDAERLAAAVIAGVHHHPIARARLGSFRGTDVRYRWEIAEELRHAPLEVVSCSGEQELEMAREGLMSMSPSLESAPPFALVLAHHPRGDAIILNLSHAAGDGISALRLMSSILNAYGGVKDKPSPVDALGVRDIGALVNSRSLTARLARGRMLAEQAVRATRSPARIAPDGASGQAGYGFELMRFDSVELEQVISLRSAGATVNDVLLGALAVTVRRWNERHDSSCDEIGLMMPVNLRPAEWSTDVVGNFASYVSVNFDGEDHAGVPAAVAAAAVRTREIKERGAAGLIIDLLEVPTATLPTAIKRRLQHLIPLTGSRVVDTAVLSNLGRLDSVAHLDDEAGTVRRVWFSPPGRMPLGLSLGAATYQDELFLTLRYRHALLDAAGAANFAAILRDVLTAPAAETPP